jgi:hypothetical protein
MKNDECRVQNDSETRTVQPGQMAKWDPTIRRKQYDAPAILRSAFIILH